MAFNSILMLAGSVFIGSHLLEFFGITLPVVRVAGGVVLIAFGWKLLQSGSDARGQARRGQGRECGGRRSVLSADHAADDRSRRDLCCHRDRQPAAARTPDMESLVLLGSSAIAGIVAIALTVYVCYRSAERVVALLGEGGTNVVVRLSAFILLCLGIQILWTGYSALAATIH